MCGTNTGYGISPEETLKNGSCRHTESYSNAEFTRDVLKFLLQSIRRSDDNPLDKDGRYTRISTAVGIVGGFGVFLREEIGSVISALHSKRAKE